jgi:hypothetical protein
MIINRVAQRTPLGGVSHSPSNDRTYVEGLPESTHTLLFGSFDASIPPVALQSECRNQQIFLKGPASIFDFNSVGSAMSTAQARTAFLIASLAKITHQHQKLSLEMAALRGFRRELETDAQERSSSADDLGSTVTPLASSCGFPDKDRLG